MEVSTLSIIRPVLFVGLFAAGGYWMLHSRITATPREPEAPGWVNLDDCAETASFDGTKRLTLLADGSASYWELKSEGARPKVEIKGKWSLDVDAGRYRIELGGIEHKYLLVTPSNSIGCILIAGEPSSADLTQSWFPLHVDEGDLVDDRDRDPHDF